jgi:TRAP-type C4-dicarboxylate transport system substrate-binding protein
MKTKMFPFALVLSLAFSIALYAVPAPSAAASSEKVYNWTFMSTIVASSESYAVFQDFCKAVKEKSAGRLVIRALAKGEHPYTGADILDAVRDGLTQIGETEDIYITGKEPALCPYTIPFWITPYKLGAQIFPKLLAEVFNPLLGKKYKSTAILNYLITGNCVHATRWIDSRTAGEGLRIRASGADMSKVVELCGAKPVSIQYSELYTAIQRGTINGAITSMRGAYSTKINEVAKYVTWWDAFTAWDLTVVNSDALAALPADLQKILLDTASEYSVIAQNSYNVSGPELLVAAMEEYGVMAKAISPAFRKELTQLCEPLRDNWVNSAAPYGSQVLKIVEDARQ